MEKILQLYYNNNGQREAFPNEENPCSLLDFTYTAKRMGAAPTITASIKDARVMAWSLDVFVEFQGERYFLKRLPSSTYDNTDVRYKYDLEFVSERVALDNVFFFDVVKDKTYRGATRSTSFTFYGGIEEFVARMNYSLELSKVGYTVVIDDGVTSESKQLSFDGQYFSSVLQEVYNTYNLPYYFKGKEIHIGSYDTEKTVDAVLEYGANNSLLSISKTNANHMVVNRITGVGSSDNLPYYYPNETPLGKVGVRATQNNEKLVDDDCFKIVSAEKLQLVGLNEEVRFGKYDPNSLVDGSLRYQYVATDQKAYDFVLGWPNDKKTYRAWASAEEVRGNTFYYHYHFIIRGQVTQRQGGKIRLTWTPNPNFPNIYDQTKTFGERAYGFFDNLAAYESLNGELVKADVNRVGDLDCYIDITFVGQPNTSNGSDIELHLVFTFYKQIRNIDKEFIGDVAHTTFTSIQLVTEDVGDNPYYWSTSKRTSINLTDFGLDLTSKGYTIFNSNKDAIVGDGCYLVQNAKDGYITPQPNLMPPIYRENFFDDTKDPYFYNAKNNTYNIVPNDDTQGKYEFPNPFVEGRPQEYIQNFEDIRPSIKGLVDSEGNAIDQFINFAYDDGDNDSMDDDGTLMHPYFYAQLPRFTQDNEFNLFDHAIESGEMTISMTSGNCGACSFKIAVDKDSGKNTLQVDSNGNLLKDAKGNAVFGVPQDRQNDTVNFNVWVALFKDVDTFPSIMPNNHDRNKPKKNTVKSGMKMNNDGDTFVILNIDLPQAYILAAEKRLEHELIKFMHTNNAEKFNFSVKMSRIYLAEHPELLDTLNENSTVTVSYNNLTYPLLVSSFSYKMKEGDLLPEISIELADTLAIVKNAIQQAVSDVKSHVLSVVEAKDNVIAQNTRAFLRKDVDDQAIGRTTFENGFDSNKDANFGGFVESTKGAGIFQDGNGNWHIESDFFRVRKKLSATSVEIEEAHHIGGHQMLTATSAVIDFVIEKDNAYRCFFRKDDPSGNSIHNNWMVGDQAYCKFFNIESAGEISNRYYWRAVTATNMTATEDLQSYTVNGEEVMISNYHFVDLSKTNTDGEDVPMADDNIVQLGYQGNDDPSRQNAIIMAGAGEGSPYIRQYMGINSFKMPEPDTQIKPGDNVLSGTTKFKTYKNEDKQLNDLDKEIESTSNAINNLETGTNILRNSGFNGDYDVIDLDGDGVLNADETDLFSPSLEYWDTENVKAEKSNESASGKCVVSQRRGTIKQTLDVPLEKGANYIFSFKGKGTQVTVKLSKDVEEVITLNSTTGYYEYKFEAKDNYEYISISMGATTTLFELSLIRGTISNKTWAANPLDNRKERAEYESLSYVQNLLKANTVIDGGKVSTGVVNTGLINMGNYDNEGNFVEVTAGMSGTYNNEHSVAFFGGGDLAKAIYTVSKYRDNPNYEPTAEELASMAQVVITHGGRAILNEAIVRGNIYADNGYFRGILQAKMVYTEVLHLSDGWLTNGAYTINFEEHPYTTYYCPTISRSLPPTIVLPKAQDYKGLELSFLTDVGSQQGWNLQGAVVGTDSQHGTELRDNIVYNTTNATSKSYSDWLALPKSGKMYKFISMFNQTTFDFAWVALQPID